MTYAAPTEWNTRHAIFRRTNLPCLRCGEKVRQKRQTTYFSDDGDPENDRSRIIYFCPICQNVPPERFTPAKKSRAKKQTEIAPQSQP